MNDPSHLEGALVSLASDPGAGVGVVLGPGDSVAALRVAFPGGTRQVASTALMAAVTPDVAWIDEALSRTPAREVTVVRRRGPRTTDGEETDDRQRAAERLRRDRARQAELQQATMAATLAAAALDGARHREDAHRRFEEAIEVDFLAAAEPGLPDEALLKARESMVARWCEAERALRGPAQAQPRGDAEQLAVMVDASPALLVVGPAGSGKTTALLDKVWFLIARGGLNPDEVLLLTPGEAAAEQMRRSLATRLGPRAPVATTFGGLARALVPVDLPAEDAQRLVRTLTQTAFEASDPLDPASFAMRLWRAMQRCWARQTVDSARDLTPGAAAILARIQPLSTLRGQVVTSLAHKMLADALFVHDVRYVATCVKGPPHLRIFLGGREVALWVSHLAPNAQTDPSRRRWPDERARRYWERHPGTAMLEFDARQIGQIDVERWLKGQLAPFGVTLWRLDERVILARCRKLVEDAFCAVAHCVVRHARAQELSVSGLRARFADHPTEDGALLALRELVVDLYGRYLAALSERSVMDADGLLIAASDALRAGQTSATVGGAAVDVTRLRLLVCDDHQDHSRLRERLIGDLQDLATGLHLCCAGDLWQAVEGLTGGSQRYLRRFPELHPGARRIELTGNHRMAPPLIPFTESFMSWAKTRATSDTPRAQGPSAPTTPSQHLRVVTRRHLGLDALDRHKAARARAMVVAAALSPDGDLASLAPTRPNQSVLMLARDADALSLAAPSGQEASDALDLNLSPEQDRLEVKTVDDARGLEADLVILSDVCEARYPMRFMVPDLLTPLGVPWEALVATERQLLYVAVSRARHGVILLEGAGLSPDLESHVTQLRSRKEAPTRGRP